MIALRAAGAARTRTWRAASETALAGGVGLLLGGAALAAASSPSRPTLLALVALTGLLVLMVVGDARSLFLAVLLFDIPLQWGIHFGYRTDTLEFGALGGLEVSVTTIALAGLYALWISERSTPHSGAPGPRLLGAWPLITYVAINALSLLVARDRELAGYELALLVQTLLLFVYIVSTVRTREEVRFIATVLTACLLFESVLIIAQNATGASFNFLGLSSHADVGPGGATAERVGGTVGSPNTAASFLCLLLPLAMAQLAAPVTARVRRLSAAAIVAGVVALIITNSRGGWLSFTISAAILGVAACRRGFVSPRVALAVALSVLALAVPFASLISERVSGDDRGSARSRIAMARLAEDIISVHPLLGVGVNNVGVNIRDFAGPEFGGEFLYTIHNKYLLVWSEAGIGALAAFLWFIAAMLRRGWQCVRSRDELLSPLALGLTAAVAGQLVHMAVDIFESRPQVQLLWLVAALITAMAAIVRAPSGSRKPR